MPIVCVELLVCLVYPGAVFGRAGSERQRTAATYEHSPLLKSTGKCACGEFVVRTSCVVGQVRSRQGLQRLFLQAAKQQ